MARHDYSRRRSMRGNSAESWKTYGRSPQCDGRPSSRRARVGSPRVCRNGLLEVVRDQFGHLEHRYLPFAAEDLTQLVVSVDQAPVDGILKLVLLDVVPNLLGDF